MINLGKELLTKIRREIGPVPLGTARLAFEARVWRAVAAHAPGLSAEDTVTLTQQIVRAFAQGPRRTARAGRPVPREAA